MIGSQSTQLLPQARVSYTTIDCLSDWRHQPVAGPHPYPELVRDFQSVIGNEAKQQIMEIEGRLPTFLQSRRTPGLSLLVPFTFCAVAFLLKLDNE